MKKNKDEIKDWLRPEYKKNDFKKIVRGKYSNQIHSSHMIVLDPIVAESFPDSQAVNTALLSLIELAKKSVQKLSHKTSVNIRSTAKS